MAIAGLAAKAMARLGTVSIRVTVSTTILTYLPGVNRTRRSRAQIVCDYSHIASAYGFTNKFLRMHTTNRQIILDETNEDSTVNDPVLGRHVSTTQLSSEGSARLSVKLTAVLRAEANGLPFPGFEWKYYTSIASHFVVRHGYNPPNDEQCSYWKNHFGSLRAYSELLTKRISKTLRNLAPS